MILHSILDPYLRIPVNVLRVGRVILPPVYHYTFEIWTCVTYAQTGPSYPCSTVAIGELRSSSFRSQYARGDQCRAIRGLLFLGGVRRENQPQRRSQGLATLDSGTVANQICERQDYRSRVQRNFRFSVPCLQGLRICAISLTWLECWVSDAMERQGRKFH